MNPGFTGVPFRYQTALAVVRTTLVFPLFSDLSKSLLAPFRASGCKPVVPKTCCISALVCPPAPLQMVCNGAGGQTRAEMQQVLGTTGLQPDALNGANKDFDKSLNSGNTNVVLT